MQQSSANFTARKFPFAFADAADAAHRPSNSLATGVCVTILSHLEKAAANSRSAHFFFALGDATDAVVTSCEARAPRGRSTK
jgi:hypothetical protein